MLRWTAQLVVLAGLFQAAPADPLAKIAAIYRERVKDAGVVGSSLVVVRDGAVVMHAWEGLQDVDAQRAVDENTIYHWASITKMFTGAAVMQLRDRGALSLDDPVVKFIPELRQVHSAHGDIGRVTVRQLMSHSAGFRASTWPWGGSLPWHPFEPTRWDQLAAMFPYTELLFAPGTRYSYSNPGIIFLARIVEQISGDEYETYVNKNILMPLGMTRTFFDRAPYHLRPHRSHSYSRDDDGLREERFDFDTGITASNGGLNAPMGDMARWLGFLIGDPAGGGKHDLYERILKASSRAEMCTPEIRARDGEGGSGDDVQSGLTCFIEGHLGEELIGHSGDQNGFIAHLYVHRASRSGYAAAFNTNVRSKSDPRRGTRALDNDLRDLIVQEFFKPHARAR